MGPQRAARLMYREGEMNFALEGGDKSPHSNLGAQLAKRPPSNLAQKKRAPITGARFSPGCPNCLGGKN